MAEWESFSDEEQCSIHLAATVERHLEDARKRIVAADHKSEWLREEMDILSARIKSKEEEKARVEQEPEAKVDEEGLQQLEQLLSNKENLVFRCQREVAELHKKQRELAGAEEEAERAAAEERADLASQLQVYEDMLGELENQLATQEEESEQRALRRKEKVKKICRAIDKATKEREMLRSVLQEAEDEEAKVLDQVERCRKQLKELKPLVSAAEKARTEAQAQAAMKDNDLREVRLRHARLEADVQRLMGETEAAATELEQAALDEQRHAKERRTLESEVSKLQGMAAALQKSNVAFAARTAALEESQREKDIARSKLVRKREERAAVQLKLDATLKALQTELANAQAIAKAAEADACQVREQAGEARKSEEALRNQLDSILGTNEQHNRLVQLVEQAKLKESDAQASLSKASGEVDILSRHIKACKQKLYHVKLRRQQLERHAYKLRETEDKRISEQHRVAQAKRAESDYVWNKLEEALQLSPTRQKRLYSQTRKASS